jgi:hypothetical protein
MSNVLEDYDSEEDDDYVPDGARHHTRAGRIHRAYAPRLWRGMRRPPLALTRVGVAPASPAAGNESEDGEGKGKKGPAAKAKPAKKAAGSR